MKTPVEQLQEATATVAAQAAEIDALKAKIKAMEDEKKAEEDEEDKAEDKPEGEPEDKPDEDEENNDEEVKAEVKALTKKVDAMNAFIRSPEFRASIVKGSESGTPEGGASGGKTMTKADAIAAYNKIDTNDHKGRAAFRAEHKAELGL
jgi:hypothetical protein